MAKAISFLRHAIWFNFIVLCILVLCAPDLGHAKKKGKKKAKVPVVLTKTGGGKIKGPKKAIGKTVYQCIPNKGNLAACTFNGELVKYQKTKLTAKKKKKNKKSKNKKNKLKCKVKVQSSSTPEVKCIFREQTEALVQSINISLSGLGNTIKVANQSPGNFAGKASSTIGINSVTWSNLSTGASGTATGTSDWAAAVALQTGDNKLQFTASAPDGTSATRDTTVTYYSNTDFNSPLDASPTVLYLNESENVTFLISLADGDGKTVTLHRTDANGAKLTGSSASSNEMKDNGTLPDEIEKDGTYTVMLKPPVTTTGYQYYRVEVTGSGISTYQSELVAVWVTERFTNDELETATNTGDSIRSQFATLTGQGKSAEKAYKEIAETLKQDSNIGTVGYGTGTGLMAVTKAGIILVHRANRNEQRSGGAGTNPQTLAAGGTSANLTHHRSYYAPRDLATLEKPGINIKVSTMATAATTAHSSSALFIGPHYKNPEGPDNNFEDAGDYATGWKWFGENDSYCRLHAAEERVNDGINTLTLESFYQDFERFGLIWFCSHGDTYRRDAGVAWNAAEWGPDPAANGAVVATSSGECVQRVSGVCDLSAVEDEIQKNNLGVYVSDDWCCLDLLPNFFWDYLPDLGSSVVLMGTCRGGANETLADAFLAKGAETFLSYTDYVKTNFAINTLQWTVYQWLNGLTIGEAFQSAIDKYGISDADDDPAVYTLFGNEDLKTVTFSETVPNPSFESGSLAPWEKTGDARVITKLGATEPTDGSFMGIISTGLGYTKTSGSIEYIFCAPENLKNLIFDWNFFSAEPMTWCDALDFQDTFEVTLCAINSSGEEYGCVTVLKRWIQELCNSGLLSLSDIEFDIGDVWDTGWQTQTKDISAFAGRALKLKFDVQDKGDSYFDSAALIDKIRISTSG